MIFSSNLLQILFTQPNKNIPCLYPAAARVYSHGDKYMNIQVLSLSLWQNIWSVDAR